MRRHRVSVWLTGSEDRQVVLESLSLLLESGLDMLSALQSVQVEARSRNLRRVLGEIVQEIDDGRTLADAFTGRRLLSEHEIALLAVGEETGRLQDNVAIIVQERARSRLFQARLQSAMLYPMIIIVVGIVVGVGVGWLVLPRLAEVFSNLDVELPRLTQYLITAGEYLDRSKQIVLPLVLAGSAILFYLVFFMRYTRFVGEWLLLHFPATGRLIKEIELARFGFMTGTLLSAGLPVVDSIGAMRQISSVGVYRRFYRRLHESLEAGETFAQSFSALRRSEKLVPHSIQQMVVAAEQSGNLQTTLERIGHRYEEKTEISTKNIALVLEPILLIIVWLGVLLIAAAVMLPIYSLVGGLNNSTTINSEMPVTNQPVVTEPEAPVVDTVPIDSSGETVQLRSQPDLEADILSVVTDGTEVRAGETNSGWTRVELPNGQAGWVLSRFVSGGTP